MSPRESSTSSHIPLGSGADEKPLDRNTRRLRAIASQLGTAAISSSQGLFSSSSGHHHSTLSIQQSQAHPPTPQTFKLPRYKDLPSQGGYPGCAWKVWGEGDQLGTINLLTDQVVARSAREEIRTGRSISLNWPLHLPEVPFFGRRSFNHEPLAKGSASHRKRRDDIVEAMRREGKQVANVGQGTDTVPICDEHLMMNTQSGSQWDGLRHYGHFGLNCFYGGASCESIQGTFSGISEQGLNPEQMNSNESRDKNHLGIQNLAHHGICGRGVLLDVFGFLSERAAKEGWKASSSWKGGAYDPCTTYRITVEDLIDTARHERVRFRQGDILLVRSGFTKRYYDSTAEERKTWAKRNEFAGVQQSEEMKAFLWDNHFAAVAGDAPAFESWPAPPKTETLHETLLGLWGMPIGEMFDLESLWEHCRREKRYTFHFTSWPLALYGGIASTANAAAYF
ncbi:hypothetical protein IE53DRAFT_386095 [Violaceomyces palustris]|uniref:Uncharacterized protein n=1 Tax=Violaceomyces palustris TaxID=1673888 RepID=A0ACD0P0F1_9BASI|nr:hypothetical protein IE53DRAFT_386095 [Violaceomyces palustris]